MSEDCEIESYLKYFGYSLGKAGKGCCVCLFMMTSSIDGMIIFGLGRMGKERTEDGYSESLFLVLNWITSSCFTFVSWGSKSAFFTNPEATRAEERSVKSFFKIKMPLFI